MKPEFDEQARQADPDCRTGILADAKLDGEYWTLSLESSWCFGGITEKMRVAAGAPIPKKGMPYCQYGRRGHTVRGFALDGVVVYYRTIQQQKDKDYAETRAAEAKREAELAEQRPTRDARRAALPAYMRQRLDQFESNNINWRRDYEPYELFICEQAVVFAKTLKTDEAILAFNEAPYDAQREMVPGMDDGHSGNTFGCAVRLARWLINKPENVAREHGGMCMLVGCKDFGHVIKE
jgi:hypothetical protein